MALPATGPARARVGLAAAGLAAAVALLASTPAAVAGPDPEPDPSTFDIAYPGAYAMPARAHRRIVARVRFENTGGSDSAGLDVCVVLPPGFHDAAVDRPRDRIRVTRAGAKVCWYEGAVAPGHRGRATVRATAPRRRGRYATTVLLVAVDDALVPGETLRRHGSVRVG